MCRPVSLSLTLLKPVFNIAEAHAVASMPPTGGSLGPEAALLALCGATTSWVARNILGFRGHRLRNMTLLGMTAGLAAFFGVALGGAYIRMCCLVAMLQRAV